MKKSNKKDLPSNEERPLKNMFIQNCIKCKYCKKWTHYGNYCEQCGSKQSNFRKAISKLLRSLYLRIYL